MADNTILSASATAVREEGFIASVILSPGELVEFGGSDDIQPHGTAAGDAAAMFVRAQEENQGAGIDDDIASGDEATVIFPQPGDKVMAIAGGAVTANAFVESDGNGRVVDLGSIAAVGNDPKVGIALEAGTDGDFIEVLIV